MNVQAAKTIHCISIDPDPIAGGVGGSEWRTSQEEAERLFQKMCADPAHSGDTLIRFDLQVPAMATPEQITETVDNAAWEQSYTEISRVVVAVGA